MVEAGAVLLLVNLLSSAKSDVVEQALWALGNIAGETYSPEFRDKVLEAGCMDALLKILQEPSDCFIGILRAGTCLLKYLLFQDPEPRFELALLPALPVIRNLLYLQDIEVLEHACWAVYFSSDSCPSRIQDVILSGVWAALVSLLDHGASSVIKTALEAIESIIDVSDEQTQSVLQTSCLNPLKNLLSHSDISVRRDACWTISTFTEGNRSQIQAVINADIIPHLLSMLQNDDTGVKREAACAVSNAASGGDIAQVEYLLTCGCFQPVSDLLDDCDLDVVEIALEAIENILKTGKDKQRTKGLGSNPYVPLLKLLGALPKLEHLQGTDQGSDVFQITSRIMTTYLDPELNADEA